MKNQNDTASELSKLRQKAELQIPPKLPALPLSEADSLKLVHELEVHQVELEMQNEELQLANSRLKNIVEATQTGIWEWNIQTNEIVIDNVWAQIVGYTTDELSQINTASFRSMVHPNDLKQADELLDRHFTGELPYFDFECRMKHKDGRWVWIHDRGSIISRTDDGKPLLMFGTHTDITERELAGKVKHNSDEKYRMLFENSLTGILITRPDGAILAANPEACRMLDRTESDICKFGRDGIVDLTNPNLPVALEKRGRTGHFHGELTFKRSDGTVFPVDLESGIFIDFNGQKYAYNFFQDITERKQAEKILKDSEEKYRFMFANNPQPMWIFDIETLAFLEVNHAAVNHYGYSADEFLTMTLKDIRPSEDIPALLKSVEVSNLEYNQQGEFRHTKKNGEIIDVQITTLVFNGRKARHVLIHDVTEQNRIKAAMRKANRRLESVIEGTHVATWEWNVQTGEVVFDELWVQLVGYTLKELEPISIKTWETLTHPDDLRQSVDRLHKHFKGELPYYDLECRMKHKDGRWVWVHDRGRVTTRTDDGKPLMMFGTHSDITERKLAENALLMQQQLLSKLTRFSIDLSRLSAEENLEIFICKQIKEFTGAFGVLFSEYHEETKLISPKHVELEASLLSKVVRRLDKKIQDMHSILDERAYQRITQRIIEKYDSLTDATFGTISQPVNSILSMVLNVERYIGVSYMVDGKLYGTSLLAMANNQPDPPIEFLENIASLVAISLRRKRAEEALKDSEYKYKLLTESNSDVVFIIDKLGRLHFINESVKKVFGYEPEEVIGRLLTSFIYEKQIPEALLQLANVFTHKEVTGFITQIYHKDKRLVNVEINGKIVVFNGQLVAQGTIRDITEKKQIEARLKLSLDRNKALLGANPDLMFVFDSACRIIDFHSESTDQLYVKPELFLNKPVDEIFPSEISRMTHRMVNAVLSTGKPEYSTYELPSGDTLRSYESRYVLCGKNEVLSIVRDITERKLAEEALLNRNRLYDNLVSKIPVGVYILHSKPDGAFALDYVSPRMAEMLNLSVERLLADVNTIFNAIHPADVDGFRTLSQDGIYQHRPFNWKGRILADGNIKWMHFMSVPEILKDGDILWHGLIVDITERKLAEQEINLKNEELSNLVAEKDRFFSIVAHDLRSPFNALLGLTQVLDEDLPNMKLDETQRIASALRGSALSVYDLLENLLKWSRIKRGITSFYPESFLFTTKIDEFLQPVLESATKKLIDISCYVPDDLVVFADQNMMGSIIRNLTSNAVKFTPKKGKVFLSVQVNEDQNIEISVKDSGIGMNKSILDKLFNIDRNNNRRGTEGESSSGLGLIICKEFVEKHGGRIWAESLEGKGSTFYLTLPQKEN